MNAQRHAWKVGLFVLFCLALLAGLLLYFSKGLTIFSNGYAVHLRTSNVGGIKAKASVLMAGIPIGSVSAAELGPRGTNVTLTLRIEPRYSIPSNALFVIEQSGFLGDQYVAVYAGRTDAPPLKDGDTVACQEPFNLQEVARSAAGFITRIDETAKKLNDAITRVDLMVLNEATLTNLALTLGNFRQLSEKALVTMDGLERAVQSNVPPISLAVSNVAVFSDQLGKVAQEVDLLVRSNRMEVTAAVKNIESSSGILKGLLTDLSAGQGLLGALMRQRPAETNFAETLQHLAQISSNLTVTSSNLNTRGLWWLLFNPKPGKANATTSKAPGPGKQR